MRLKPRTIKRKMFTCTECGECISACTQIQHGEPERSLLRWVDGEAALPVVTGRPARVETDPHGRQINSPSPLPRGGIYLHRVADRQ